MSRTAIIKLCVISLVWLAIVVQVKAQSQLSLSLSLSFDATGFSWADFTAGLALKWLNVSNTLSFDPTGFQGTQLAMQFGNAASPISGTATFDLSGFQRLHIIVNVKQNPIFTLKGNASFNSKGLESGKLNGQLSLSSGPLSVSGSINVSHKGLENLGVSVSVTAHMGKVRFISTTHAGLLGFTQQDFRFETSLYNLSLSSVTTFNPQGFAGEQIKIVTTIFNATVQSVAAFDAKGFRKAEMSIDTFMVDVAVKGSATFEVSGFTGATLMAEGIFSGLMLSGSASFDRSGFSSSDLLVTSTLLEILSLDGQMELSREGLQYGRLGLSLSIAQLGLSSTTTFVAGSFQHNVSAEVSFKL